MNTTNEAVVAELQAQIAGLQDIVVAQATTIKALRADVANYRAHNDMMILRTKRAEDEVVRIRDSVMRREARALVVPAKCDGNNGGPRCADPECWNDGPQPAIPTDDLLGESEISDETRRQIEWENRQ